MRHTVLRSPAEADKLQPFLLKSSRIFTASDYLPATLTTATSTSHNPLQTTLIHPEQTHRDHVPPPPVRPLPIPPNPANPPSRDLVMCRKQPGIAIGRLCDKCDGKCPVCDSYVRPTTLVRICDECSFGNYQNKCVVCGGEGISDAFYCFECTRLEKDRDGCPKIINLGSSRTDVRFPPYALYMAAWILMSLSTAVLPKENESDGVLVGWCPGLGGFIFLILPCMIFALR